MAFQLKPNARPAKTRSLQCRARETGWEVKYKKAQFLMKLRLISKNVFIKLDGRRIHHIRLPDGSRA